MRLDNRFDAHPKIIPLSDGAFRLHVSALLYSSGLRTAGRIPIEAVPTLMPRYRTRYRDELADSGLWVIGPHSVQLGIYDERTHP